MWGIEILQRYIEWLPGFLPIVVLGACVAALLMWARERITLPIQAVLIGLTVTAGLVLAWNDLSLFDDAFISLRYAKNLLNGDGFIFNPGEPVLGITNFAWALLIAAVSTVTRLDLPRTALLCALFGYLAVVGATWRVSLALWGNRLGPPLAAMGVSLCWLSTRYASTGLESLAVVALVLFGLHALLTERYALAGLWLTLATLTRLDQGLFLAVGALVALRSGALFTYLRATPLVPALLAYCAWTYGDPLPNTAAAKSGPAFFSMGTFYVWSFLLTTHLVWILPLVGWSATHRESTLQQRFQWFVVPGMLLWTAYVSYVGGDFMIGRFTLVLIPLLLLSAEAAVQHIRRPALAIAGAAWLGATVYGLPVIKAKDVEWWLADESTIYPVVQLHPLIVDQHNFFTGNAFYKAYTDRGLKPKLAAHGIGMLSYYSELPVVDMLGLTDPVTARQPLPTRRRPGHERKATLEHLMSEGAVFTSLAAFPGFEGLTRLRTPRGHAMRRWHVLQYKPEEIAALQEAAPEIAIPDIEEWTRNTTNAASRFDLPVLEARLRFLEVYYFQQPGADLSLKAELEAAIAHKAKQPSTNAKGIATYDPERATPGRLLVTSFRGHAARLLELDGTVLHRWRVPPAAIFPDPKDRMRGAAKFFCHVTALEDGSLLVVYDGLAMAKISRDSEVVWIQRNQAHHSIVPDERGHLWTLTRRLRGETPFGRAMVDDFVAELDSEGNLIREHSILDAIHGADPSLVEDFTKRNLSDPEIRYDQRIGYPVHLSSIHRLPPGPGPLEGSNLLLASRNLGVLFVMDTETGELIQTLDGDFDRPFAAQHVQDGIVLFDGAHGTRALKVDAEGRTLWTWARDGLSSPSGSVQALGHGHLQITVTDRGRAVEVDGAGEVVWEWSNPQRTKGGASRRVPEVLRLPVAYGDSWLP